MVATDPFAPNIALNPHQQAVYLDRYSLRDRSGTPVEKTVEESHARVARALAVAETTDLMDKAGGVLMSKRSYWELRFGQLLADFKFLPGGRILSNAGSGTKATYLNCFQGDTPVHTRDGVVPIRSLSGEHEILSEGRRFRKATFSGYGIQDIWEVTLQNGVTFKATPDHRWVVMTVDGRGQERVPTRDLAGRRIPLNPRPWDVEQGEFVRGARHGIVFGDGSIDRKATYVALFGEKQELGRWFDSDVRAVPATIATAENTRVTRLPETWKGLPDAGESASYRRGFVAGLIATDGHVDRRGHVMIHNKDPEILARIAERMIGTGLIPGEIACTRELSPYDGSEKPVYKLTIMRCSIDPRDILRSSHRENWDRAPTPRTGTTRVASVRSTGRSEEVFCCVEPETHTMTIGHGYLTGQCFVIPDPHDSRDGIMDSLRLWTDIMARGGGCGVNLSSLRPRNSYIAGLNGFSSGPINWAELFSTVTGKVISQGGTRRGAAMLMLWDWHPDILEFITAKSDLDERGTPRQLQHANVSVCVSDAFMGAVEDDRPWDLVFPELTDPHYQAEWDGDMAAWRSKGYAIKVYDRRPARTIFRMICHAAWASAEPGLVFLERANKLHPGSYFETLIATNPCSEQVLPAYGVCNLGSLNLGAYVADGDFRHDAFARDVAVAVRLLDNAIDLSPPFLGEHEDVQRNSRRIGLGTMGLADTFLKLGIRYGSPDSVALTEAIFRTLRDASYEASSDIAKEKGSFPAYDAPRHLSHPFIQALPDHITAKLASQGLRNSVLMTQAPTGSTSIVAGASSGIEPVFADHYQRTDRTGVHVVKHWFWERWDRENPGTPPPDYAVTAHDLRPEDHLAVQAAVQRYIDTSISKTTNGPNSDTVDDVERLYRSAYTAGVKGITYYRDGSRDAVLTPIAKAPEVHANGKVDEVTARFVLDQIATSLDKIDGAGEKDKGDKMPAKPSLPIKRDPGPWPGLTWQYKATNAHGETENLYITVNGLNGRPLEVFVAGPTANHADQDYIARLVSHELRRGVPAAEVIADGWEIRGTSAVFNGPGRPITCTANAIAKALEDWVARHTPAAAPEAPATTGPPCPRCGTPTIRESSCVTCPGCAWSRCG